MSLMDDKYNPGWVWIVGDFKKWGKGVVGCYCLTFQGSERNKMQAWKMRQSAAKPMDINGRFRDYPEIKWRMRRCEWDQLTGVRLI